MDSETGHMPLLVPETIALHSQCRCILGASGLLSAAVLGAVASRSFIRESQPSDLVNSPAALSLPQTIAQWEPFTCTERPGQQFIAAQESHRKGFAVDDTTWQACSHRIPASWPAASRESGRVQAVHLFMGLVWNLDEHGDDERWGNLFAFLNHTDGKALLGSRVSCQKDEDDKDWASVRRHLQLLGRERILGISIGNELDLGADFGIGEKLWPCVRARLLERVEDLQTFAGGEFSDIPVTTIFSEHAFITPNGSEWVVDPLADPDSISLKPRVEETLLFLQSLPSNFVYGFNSYSYFSPCPPAAEISCEEWQARATCFDGSHCSPIRKLQGIRHAVDNFDQKHGRTIPSRLWIGEMGWSSPAADTNEVDCSHYGTESCPGWSNMEMFRTYYRNYLSWNLTIGDGLISPEYAFYFAIRDAALFGQSEHFGLVGGTMFAHPDRSPNTLTELVDFCSNPECKV